jgi:hypothetical protein
MEMSLPNLKKIEKGKTVFYNSPFSETNELVRVGIDRENSFYHSLLLSYAEDYPSCSSEEQDDMVSRFIESLMKKVSIDDWEELNNEYNLVSYSSELMSSLQSFYEYIETRKMSDLESIRNVVSKLQISSNFELYEAIFELLSFSNFKNALKMTNKDSSDSESVDEYRKLFISNIITILNSSKEFKAIEMEKKRYIINIVNNFLVNFFREIEKQTFNKFKSKLLLVESNVNNFVMDTVSKRLKRNIYIVNGSNRLPYALSPNIDRGRKNIVLLQFQNSFELVGKILPKNDIIYEFEAENKFIRKVNMFLVSPEDIHEKYPSLAEYLPKLSQESPRNLYSDSDDDRRRKNEPKREEKSRLESRGKTRRNDDIDEEQTSRVESRGKPKRNDDIDEEQTRRETRVETTEKSRNRLESRGKQRRDNDIDEEQTRVETTEKSRNRPESRGKPRRDDTVEEQPRRETRGKPRRDDTVEEQPRRETRGETRGKPRRDDSEEDDERYKPEPRSQERTNTLRDFIYQSETEESD